MKKKTIKPTKIFEANFNRKEFKKKGGERVGHDM